MNTFPKITPASLLSFISMPAGAELRFRIAARAGLLALATAVAATNPAPAAPNRHAPETHGPWPMFHANPARTGTANIHFQNVPFSRAWTFDLGRHTWSYCQGASVWSACVVSGSVDGHPRIFAGAYDHNLYALDPDTGKEVWRFTAGCLITAAPAFAVIEHRPMVFLASADRSLYAIDARTGRKIWQIESYPWTYTIGESIAGSPLLAPVRNHPVLFFTMWNSDRRPLRTLQTGELFAVNPINGRLRWRRKISTTPLTAPTFLVVDGRPEVFVGSEAGEIVGCDAFTGKTALRIVTGHKILATPVGAHIGGQPILFIANAFGMVRCMSARSGKFIWKYKSGHEILSTPALVKAGSKLLLIVGSSDRFVHCIEAKSGRRVWRFMTRKYVVASPAVALVHGRPMVFINSLDNRLYGLDAQTGCEILRFSSGDMLWPYETRGASIWSSPSFAVRSNGDSLLLFPAHDGKLYAFRAAHSPTRSRPKIDAQLVSGIPDRTPEDRDAVGGARPDPALLYGPPALAFLLFLASLALTFSKPKTNPFHKLRIKGH